MDTQEPVPEQVLLEQTISAGPLTLQVTATGNGGVVRLTVNGERLHEQDVKGECTTAISLEAPSGLLRVLTNAGAQGLSAVLL